MSLENNKFQVYLPSNVKGNPRNKPYLYETELSKPMDLPGKWDVPLINISYPHNWENLDKSYSYFILRLNKPDEQNLNLSLDQFMTRYKLIILLLNYLNFKVGWLSVDQKSHGATMIYREY